MKKSYVYFVVYNCKTATGEKITIRNPYWLPTDEKERNKCKL